MDLIKAYLTPASLLLFIILSGFILRRLPKKRSYQITFTLHKLAALAAVIIAATVTFQMLESFRENHLIASGWFLILLAAVGQFITGGLMSASQNNKVRLLCFHRIFTAGIPLFVIAILYIWRNR